MSEENVEFRVPETPIQFDMPQLVALDAEVDSLIRVQRARDMFRVNGSGLTVAVLDTGLRTTHVDFAGKVAAQRNFTADNGGNADNASDGQGHGTNVGGIIVANAIHKGIATGGGIVPLKVLPNSGFGNFNAIRDALIWIRDNHQTFNISVVNMSLGDQQNHIDDAGFNGQSIQGLVRELKDRKIVVLAAAGNEYFQFGAPGMSFPSILREVVSVGAVYDSTIGRFEYESGAIANTTGRDRLTPFSQRLHQDQNPTTKTDIFAPGAPITSSGINNDFGESIQHGTSQATPVTAGVVMLIQEFFLKATGSLPSVDVIVDCLRNGGVPIIDGDDEDDNVPHTNKTYLRIDALSSLEAARRHLQITMLITKTALRTA